MPFQAWIFLAFRLYSRCPNLASMGPCPFRHGYDSPREALGQTVSASMGPCLFRHGYGEILTAPNMVTYLLQWGHALSDMDITVHHNEVCNKCRLQWGHALSGMDTRERGRAVRRGLVASMGPCLFRHGYNKIPNKRHTAADASMGPCPFRHGYMADTAQNKIDKWMLQWGHALSGMDTTPSVSDTHSL